MTNSHLLGFVTFGTFALMALLAWVVSVRHPDIRRKPAERRRVRFTALWLLLGGAAFGWFAFSVDNQMRVTTLHEVMVEGSAGIAPGVPAPVRTVSFTVEHPGVAHELFLSPASDFSHPPQADVELAFSLHGPDEKSLIPERTERFGVRAATRNRRADWDGKAFSFTPTVAGPHTIRVTVLTVDIPRIQVRIADPEKRDGKRMPGY
jgi:hypothetical protein